jgi:N-methylhydantoinase B
MLPTKPSGVLVRESETIVVESPGAGGYGTPSERSREAITLDRASGKFSKTYLVQWYSLPRAAE